MLSGKAEAVEQRPQQKLEWKSVAEHECDHCLNLVASLVERPFLRFELGSDAIAKGGQKMLVRSCTRLWLLACIVFGCTSPLAGLQLPDRFFESEAVRHESTEVTYTC